MQALVTGGSGFIGKALCERLLTLGYEVTIVSRTPEKIDAKYKSIPFISQLGPTQAFNVVVNLAGEPIANQRWSEAQLDKIRSSRLSITTGLIEYFEKAARKPEVFISGSAIGYYGLAGSGLDKPIDENARGDKSFSSVLCKEWEAKALKAQGLGIRTCLLRTGIVLGAKGGALSKMLPPFKAGLGGPVGDGEQWMPWIHQVDMVRCIESCITNPEISGPVNAVAPEPVRNREFAKTLGATLRRPAILPMPAWAIKVLMGQMGEELLLHGKKVVPNKLQLSGFEFKYAHLDQALKACCR